MTEVREHGEKRTWDRQALAALRLFYGCGSAHRKHSQGGIKQVTGDPQNPQNPDTCLCPLSCYSAACEVTAAPVPVSQPGTHLCVSGIHTRFTKSLMQLTQGKVNSHMVNIIYFKLTSVYTIFTMYK